MSAIAAAQARMAEALARTEGELKTTQERLAGFDDRVDDRFDRIDDRFDRIGNTLDRLIQSAPGRGDAAGDRRLTSRRSRIWSVPSAPSRFSAGRPTPSRARLRLTKSARSPVERHENGWRTAGSAGDFGDPDDVHEQSQGSHALGCMRQHESADTHGSNRCTESPTPPDTPRL